VYDFTSYHWVVKTFPPVDLVKNRPLGEEARRARLQYLTIEEELERAYRYVAPCEQNARAFSYKFAEVIGSGARAYEVRCKKLYAEFYNGGDKPDVFNYLALDRFLKLADQQVAPLLALDSFGG
jgi:hypothetical protein